MDIIKAAEEAYAGSEIRRPEWAGSGLIFSTEVAALVWAVPHLPLSSRKYIPSYADLIASDWEVV